MGDLNKQGGDIKYKETDEGYQITANNNEIKRLFDYFNDGL